MSYGSDWWRDMRGQTPALLGDILGAHPNILGVLVEEEGSLETPLIEPVQTNPFSDIL
jgi:hypothetical protein